MISWKGLHEYAEEYPLVKSWVSGHLMNENPGKLRLVPARITANTLRMLLIKLVSFTLWVA